MPTPDKENKNVEFVKDWIETCLDADAHGNWHNAPNFNVIQNVAELMAPRIVERITQITVENEERTKAMIEEILESTKWGRIFGHGKADAIKVEDIESIASRYLPPVQK